MIRVTLTGPWKECVDTLLNLQKNLPEWAENVLEEQGKYLVKEIQSHIQSQDLPWVPLAAMTVAKKGHSEIYLEYGDLFDSFNYLFTRNSATQKTIFTAAGDGVNHDGKSLKEVMFDNEYGTTNVPARPLIRPTYWNAAADLRANWSASRDQFVKSKGINVSSVPL